MNIMREKSSVALKTFKDIKSLTTKKSNAAQIFTGMEGGGAICRESCCAPSHTCPLSETLNSIYKHTHTQSPGKTGGQWPPVS